MRALILFFSTLCASLFGCLIAVLLEVVPLDSILRSGLVGLMVLCFLAAYLTPAWVAIAHNLERANAIMIINILLGWTVVGWIVAYTRALRCKAKSKSPWSRSQETNSRGCPVCGYARTRCNDDLPPLIDNRKAKAEMEYREQEERIDPVSPPFRRRD